MVLYYMMYAALVGSVAYMGQMLSPKMLVYKLRIGGLPGIARSPRGGYNLALSAGVELMNDNLLDLDIHAISFDFYAPPGKSKDDFIYLGTVQNPPNEHSTIPTSTTASVKNSITSLSRSNDDKALQLIDQQHTPPPPQQPFWSVSSQSQFRTRSRMHLTTLRLRSVLRSLGRFFGQLLRHGGSIHNMPTSGVAHVSVRHSNYTAAFMTLSVRCENRLDVRWYGAVEITGQSCAMQSMVPGWSDLESLALRMREQQQVGVS